MSDHKQAKNAPLRVSELMQSSETSFGKVLQRARALEQLNQQISGLLDDEIARNCQVANIRDGRLIFACKSSGSATRLRMQANQLLDDLNAAGLDEIEAIEVKMSF